MRVLLVDDESLQLLRLENVCKKVLPSASFASFSNPLLAVKAAEKEKADLAFLDVEMPGMNGIALAKKLKSINPLTKIIFVTAYDNYALDAFKVHASGYIVKPVYEAAIKVELEELSKPIDLDDNGKLQIKCFGNFEIFHNGEPLKFSYSKSKELLAYLIDREGSSINIAELNAVLWEEDHSSYLRNIIADIQRTLEAIKCQDVFIKRRNECFVDISKISCDAYEYKKGNPTAIRMYRGEYMIQYPWAIFKAE